MRTRVRKRVQELEAHLRGIFRLQRQRGRAELLQGIDVGGISAQFLKDF
jgi:hypothetical protein